MPTYSNVENVAATQQWQTTAFGRLWRTNTCRDIGGPLLSRQHWRTTLLAETALVDHCLHCITPGQWDEWSTWRSFL